MGDVITDRIATNLLNCLEDMDDVVEYCQGLLTNNNVIILIEAELYHQFKQSCNELIKVRDKLYQLYLNLEKELNLSLLDLTLEGYDWIEYINELLTLIEAKWTDGEIDVNKYLLAQAILALKLDSGVVLDIDDLELVLKDKNSWICAYITQEGDLKVCHCSAWKTKQEALMFALQNPGCRRDYVFNRFLPQTKR